MALELDIYCALVGLCFCENFPSLSTGQTAPFHAGIFGLPVTVVWKPLIGKSVFSFCNKGIAHEDSDKNHGKP